MEKKLYIKTYGCQMNEYDSQKMTEILKELEGYSLTQNPEDASIILFNTCSIREKAQEKVFSDLGRVRHIKQNNPDVIIGVGGCVASQEGAVIIDRAPYVDIVFGPQTLHRIPELIKLKNKTGKSQIDISFPEIEKFDNMPEPKVSGVTAFVSIMEGCSKYCSYCVVPYTRGEEISRPFDDVIAEIKKLANQGVREVNLLGQNVNAYRGRITDVEFADFPFLLEVINGIDNIYRIRYTTSHPTEMSQRLIDCYAKLNKLSSHLHLPVQSGSDKILSLMKRGYTVLEYKSILKKIKAHRHNISFSSDFIVGFPSEDENDFQKTMKLIDDIKFDTSFSFIYSPRPGTPAANILDLVSKQDKLDRLYLLQQKLDSYAKEINNNMLGTIQSVLVEGLSKKNHDELTGRTDNFKVVNFKGDKRLVGSMVNVKIIECLSNSLKGEIITID